MSVLLPARARHRARPATPRSGPAAKAPWVLAAVGIVLLSAAGAGAIGFGEEQPTRAGYVAADAERPVGLEIPAIDVAVVVASVGLTGDQHLEVPSFGETGWYRLGPRPGEPGHAVIAGHVDSRTGPDVFHQLHALAPGDEVRVRMSTGSVVTFNVDKVERQPKEDLPESPMWRRGERPQLALVTCGGIFDRERRTYPENLVAYATAA